MKSKGTVSLVGLAALQTLMLQCTATITKKKTRIKIKDNHMFGIQPHLWKKISSLNKYDLFIIMHHLNVSPCIVQ